MFNIISILQHSLLHYIYNFHLWPRLANKKTSLHFLSHFRVNWKRLLCQTYFHCPNHSFKIMIFDNNVEVILKKSRHSYVILEVVDRR